MHVLLHSGVSFRARQNRLTQQQQLARPVAELVSQARQFATGCFHESLESRGGEGQCGAERERVAEKIAKRRCLQDFARDECSAGSGELCAHCRKRGLEIGGLLLRRGNVLCKTGEVFLQAR